MRTKRRTAAVVAAWTAAGVLGAATLAGVARAADSGSSSTPSSTSSATNAASGALAGRPGLAQLRQLGSRVLHGEFVVKTKDGDRTVDTQLGAISSVSATSMTVKSSDGYTQTWTLASTTRVRANKGKGTTADLKVGETVRLLGPRSGSDATAALVVVPPASTGTAPSTGTGSAAG
ncbi:MAG TPA: hypothetical protein VIJ54_12095 [Actinomycetes bacterium]